MENESVPNDAKEIRSKSKISILHYIDLVSEVTGNLVSYLTIPVMFIILFEVLMRYFFLKSQTWSFEMSQFLFAAVFALGGGYTLLHKGHVRMDIFYSRLSPKRQALMDVATFIFFLTFVLVLIWKGSELASRAIFFHEQSDSSWHPVLWPIRVMIPLGGFLILLQGLGQLVRDVLVATGRMVIDEH
jgi:TRAP-type mannitol/chloroaromatic compound transport system permease small subunit